MILTNKRNIGGCIQLSAAVSERNGIYWLYARNEKNADVRLCESLYAELAGRCMD